MRLFFLQIFDCILSVRSNELGQLGCRDNDGSIKFSPFYVCMRPVSSSEAPPTKLTPTLVDYHTVFEAMLSCLQKVKNPFESFLSLKPFPSPVLHCS